ncbi:MAG TPA: GNAT family N-acetyltransferase [Ignavibacteria bacterium]|nr:GNAT family N-acetyltransferase [Ignavibacteria bacterium]
MSVEKININESTRWKDFLKESYNIFYDYDFLSYNDAFGKNFKWHHLLFKSPDTQKLNGILTGCDELIDGKKFYISCNGASFGGFLWKKKVTTIQMIESLEEFKSYLKENGFSGCILRNIPLIYPKNFNQEYEYALLKTGFTNSDNVITNIIRLNDFDWTQLNNPLKRNIHNCSKIAQIKYLEGDTYKDYLNEFYAVLEKGLKAKNTHPTHTLDELIFIKENNKDKLFFFICTIEEKIAAVCLLFAVEKDVILNFYLATDEEYRIERVADYLLYETIEWSKKRNYRLYDIGTSEKDYILNQGLFLFKKKFKAHGFLRRTFQFNF